MCGAAPLGSDLMKRVTSILPNASIGQGYGKISSKEHSDRGLTAYSRAHGELYNNSHDTPQSEIIPYG